MSNTEWNETCSQAPCNRLTDDELKRGDEMLPEFASIHAEIKALRRQSICPCCLGTGKSVATGGSCGDCMGSGKVAVAYEVARGRIKDLEGKFYNERERAEKAERLLLMEQDDSHELIDTLKRQLAAAKGEASNA